jgi:ABC-type polysaccharide/polyol phosphate transport system ATPase subunit
MGADAIVVEHLTVRYRILRRASVRRRLPGLGGLTAQRETFEALRQVSFRVPQGQTVAVIGPNGAGKSTLLRTLAGIYRPDAGTVRLNSDSVSLLSLGAGFENDLTGRENIRLNGILLGLRRREVEARLDEIIAFADIGDFIDQPIRTYSTGMRSRLAFAIASTVAPDILLLDEVLGVGDEAFRAKSQARIHELIRSQRTVVLVSHNMGTVTELCDLALWLDCGVVREFGPAAAVAPRYQAFARARRKSDALRI